MARLTKKQLQTDQLQHALVDARDYVSSHRLETVRWAALGGAVLLVIAGVWGFIVLRDNRLGGRLSQALALFDAPLVTDGSPVAPGQRVFKDSAERLAAVKQDLRALAKDAPSSEPGRAAAMLLLSLDGKPTPAGIDAAQGLARNEKGTIVGGIAAVAALDAQAASGQAKEAIETAKRYLEAAEPPLPKDILLFTLARLYEKTGQSAEAKSAYQRVVNDFPDSPMRAEAQTKVTGL